MVRGMGLHLYYSYISLFIKLEYLCVMMSPFAEMGWCIRANKNRTAPEIINTKRQTKETKANDLFSGFSTGRL